MKSIKKFLFIMVALATALAFVSCSNGDDGGASSNNSNSNNSSNNSADNNNSSNNNNNADSGNNVSKPSVVATYEADSEATVLKFFNDNTWSVTDCSSNKNEIFLAEGTYQGNPAKNAKIYITLVKYMDWDINEVYEIPSNKQEEVTVEIKNGILKLDFYFNQDDEVESFTRINNQ